MSLRPRFDSLFWKLFALVWLTNVLAVTLASLFVVHIREERLAQQHFLDRAPVFAHAIVERYERDGSVVLNKRQKYRQEKHLRHDLKRANIRITDDKGQLVFQRFTRNHSHYKERTTSITSDSGKTYHVTGYAPIGKAWIPQRIVRLHMLQFTGLLIGAALVSFIATLLIQRPLNQLSGYSRQIAGGQFNHQLDDKLLHRKDTIGELAREVDHL